jgi:DNA-binding response OmpR family regulator
LFFKLRRYRLGRSGIAELELFTMETQAILVASFDPNLADVRKHALESAGYLVVPADSLLAVRSGCELGTIALVVIGYSLPPSEKRRVFNEVRQVCGTAAPILELYNHGTPILAGDAVTAHSSQAPDDFVEQVRVILNGSSTQLRTPPRGHTERCC